MMSLAVNINSGLTSLLFKERISLSTKVLLA